MIKFTIDGKSVSQIGNCDHMRLPCRKRGIFTPRWRRPMETPGRCRC
jgi:hypothetical protein